MFSIFITTSHAFIFEIKSLGFTMYVLVSMILIFANQTFVFEHCSFNVYVSYWNLGLGTHMYDLMSAN